MRPGGASLSVIILTWVERKVIGRLQMRLGPMRVGPYGTLQGIADTIKLLTKEDLRPQTADRWTFELAPFVIVVPVFLAFVTLPLTADLFVRNLTLGLFYIVAVSGVSIVGFVMAGWGSDNKYALLGGVARRRPAHQLRDPAGDGGPRRGHAGPEPEPGRAGGRPGPRPLHRLAAAAVLHLRRGGAGGALPAAVRHPGRGVGGGRRAVRGVLGHPLVDVPDGRVREHGAAIGAGFATLPRAAGTGRWGTKRARRCRCR